MSTIKVLERLQKLHFLIKQECTGSPFELSRRLRVSERTVYNLMEQLKDFNAHIGYDRSRKTYYYKDDFALHISISMSIANRDEVTEIFAGSYLINKKAEKEDRGKGQ